MSFKADPSNLIKYFTDTKQDISVYVRYPQAGQIQRKNLSTQIRPFRGLRIGASLSVRYKLEDQSNAWSQNLPIVEFKARTGDRYIVTAGIGENALAAPRAHYQRLSITRRQPQDPLLAHTDVRGGPSIPPRQGTDHQRRAVRVP
ncbi:hypothetical protein BC938DRAFT_478999 [Jimgerdemannia flammicorona]|uniref:Uncharacterized protein n=1 Tax=Jimgerdemannia flammicorona TaxID=994334 RepID=A0A433QLW4_9FUNG|nr:hypothetical protein BC938DRAFT_478999 [Jimgerdemannia flammicorona]